MGHTITPVHVTDEEPKAQAGEELARGHGWGRTPTQAPSTAWLHGQAADSTLHGLLVQGLEVPSQLPRPIR